MDHASVDHPDLRHRRRTLSGARESGPSDENSTSSVQHALIPGQASYRVNGLSTNDFVDKRALDNGAGGPDTAWSKRIVTPIN
jgi:hypothetical protein